MKLNVFSEYASWLTEKPYEPIFYPFWGKPSVNAQTLKKGYYPWQNCFDNYLELGKSFFQLSSVEQADIAVFPLNWVEVDTLEIEHQASQFLAKVRESNKPSISFFGGDNSHVRLKTDCDLVFRHSMYASSRQPNDFAMPAWGEDLLRDNFAEGIVPRPKQVKATVSFCGFSAQVGLKTYCKSILYELDRLILRRIPRDGIGHAIRLKALATLSKSSLIETNFILREKPFFSKDNANFQREVRAEYLQNIVDSDYVFCCRGYGNFSFRFYEALSCGRIPVFVNSDCVLPYDFAIDWKKYCVWIEESEISAIAEKVAEFHEQLLPQEFLDLQYECRLIWQKWLSPEGFYGNLYRHLPFLAKNTADAGVSKVS